MPFSALGLSADIVRAITDKGYPEPTPIQAKAIPPILEGRDLLATAQTGTGKTAAFTLPVLERLAAAPRTRGPRQPGKPRALVLTPTRELAAQVCDSALTYGRHLPLRTTAVYGGVSINPQIAHLRRGIDILIATPGRLLDHAVRRSVDLSGIEVLILDEADRMLDMGFMPDIRRITALLPENRQTLLFSATFSDEIRALANQLLHEPARVDISPRNTTVEKIEQRVYRVARGDKQALLSHLINAGEWPQALVFTRTKHGANKLAEQLARDGISTAAIHGNKTQAARQQALAAFKRGAVCTLVATDVAARGLDIDHLPLVVNYELPAVPEDYLHRIGRTGRAGREGTAVSLVGPDETRLLTAIERALKRKVPIAEATGFEPNIRVRSEAPVRVRPDSRPQRSRDGYPQTENRRQRPSRPLQGRGTQRPGAR